MTEDLLEQIQRKDAAAFTHGGKFHADDVFSAALLLLPESGDCNYARQQGAGGF